MLGPAAGLHAGLASQASGRQHRMLEATKLIVAVKNIETPGERHAFEHASLNVVCWGRVLSTGRLTG
jgi:hypothetical protein